MTTPISEPGGYPPCAHSPCGRGQPAPLHRQHDLAAAPTLREGENGPYTFAKVIVSDRYKDKSGEWVDGPSIPYDVAVSGDEAMQTKRERQIAGRLLIGVVLAAVLVAVLVVLFGLPALTMVGLVATVLVFVVLIAYATGY